MYICMYVCMYVWMDGWMDVCMYVCIYIYIYIYIHRWIGAPAARAGPSLLLELRPLRAESRAKCCGRVQSRAPRGSPV